MPITQKMLRSMIDSGIDALIDINKPKIMALA
jgi:hypothetical protein